MVPATGTRNHHLKSQEAGRLHIRSDIQPSGMAEPKKKAAGNSRRLILDTARRCRAGQLYG